MATIEGLFNFDEKLLARQVVRNRESAAIGQVAPEGWGPMMMGVNKIGNAIFNTDDKILKEQTIAQTSLKQVMEELGDDAKDNAKLYDALGQRLVENGASAETIMKLKSVASNQANDKANVDNANAIRNSTLALNKEKFQETKDKNLETKRKARLAEFNKTVSDEDHPAAWLYKEALGQMAGGDSAAHKEGALEFNGMVQKYVVEGGLSISDSIKAAKEEFGQKYEIKPDDSWWWFQKDNSELRRRDGSNSSGISSEAQGAVDYFEKKGK
jgi:hypothetical protein